MKKSIVLILLVLLIAANLYNFTNPNTSRWSISDLHGFDYNDLPSEKASRAGSWEMHRQNASRNSFAEGMTAPNTNSTLWTYNTTNSNTGNGVYSSAAIVNDRIYIGSGEGKLYCLDLNTGEHYWNYSTLPGAWSHGQSCSPAFANGKLFVGNDFVPKLWCIDAVTGGKIWEFSTRAGGMAGIYSSPAVHEGKVYFGSENNKVFCLPVDDPSGNDIMDYSERIWDFSAPDKVWSSPAVANDRVYVGCGDSNSVGSNKLYCLYASNGTIDWVYPSRNDVQDVISTPVIMNGKVYFGASDNNVYALNANNGTKIWNYTTRDAVISSPVVAYDRIFIGSDDDRLYCLDAETGAKIWDYATGNDIWSSPSVADGKVYIASTDGTLYCLNATAGNAQVIWSYKITSKQYGVCSSPSIADGKLIIGGATGGDLGISKIYCFADVDNTAPTILNIYPEDQSIDVPTTVSLLINFSEPMDSSTVTTDNILLKDSAGDDVAGTIQYDDDASAATFIPASMLSRGETFTVTVLSTIKDASGLGLDGNENGLAEGSPLDDFSWGFTTSVNKPPVLSTPKISLMEGDLETDFEFSVIYTDLDNDTPEVLPAFIRVLIDDEQIGRAMTVDPNAPSHWRDGNRSNGERYLYTMQFSTYGQHNYQFKCSDGIDTDSSSIFDAPLVWYPHELSLVPDQTAIEDIDLILDLNDKIHDEDIDESDLNLSTNSSYATVEEYEIKFNYPNSFNYPSGRTHEIVEIRLFDSITGHNVTQDIRVNVTPINDAPWISGITDQQVNSGKEFVLNLTSYIGDEDNELSELEISTNSSFATVTGKEITLLYPINARIAMDHINITVFDGELYSRTNITIIVLLEGMPFILWSVPLQFAMEDVDLLVDMADYITPLGAYSVDDFEVEINSTFGAINGTNITFNYPNSFTYPIKRTHEFVTVNVSFGNYTESISFKIDVHPVNDGPVLSELTTPSSSFDDTPLYFGLKYFDSDGSDVPMVEVIINDLEYPMNYVRGDIHMAGGIYQLEMNLSAGEFSYYYKVDDLENTSNSVETSEIFSLSVKEHSGTDDDDDNDEETSDRESEGGIYIWLTIAGIVMIAMTVLVLLFVLKRRRKKDAVEKWDEEEDEMMSADNAGGKNELVRELVDLEDEREEVLVRLDRLSGRLEQLDWDYEDGYIDTWRYEMLVDKCLNGRDKLDDELAEIDDDIEYLEQELERAEHRKKSSKRQYGGRGDDDFEYSSYQEAGDRWDDDYDEDWMTDEYWDD